MTPSRTPLVLRSALAFVSAVAALDAQDRAHPRERFQVLVAPGSMYAGHAVTTVLDAAIDDDGNWLVVADTDHPDQGRDLVVIVNGTLRFQEGQGMAGPPGATLKSIGSIDLNTHTEAMNVRLNNPVSPALDHALYVGGALVALEGDICPAPEFGPGTKYGNMFDVKINEQGKVLLHGYFNDPTTPTHPDYALVLLDVAAGTARVVAKTGDVIPLIPDHEITSFANEPQDTDLNSAGQTIFVARLNDPVNTHAICIEDQGNLTLVAVTGIPSPYQGIPYASFTNLGVGIGAGGDHAFQAQLQNGQMIVVQNYRTYVAEGEDLEKFNPRRWIRATLTDLGTRTPIKVDPNGLPLWRATVQDPWDLARPELVLGNYNLVYEGASLTFLWHSVSGQAFTSLSTERTAYDMSENGRWVVLLCSLTHQPIGTTAVLAEILVTPQLAPGR